MKELFIHILMKIFSIHLLWISLKILLQEKINWSSDSENVFPTQVSWDILWRDVKCLYFLYNIVPGTPKGLIIATLLKECSLLSLIFSPKLLAIFVFDAIAFLLFTKRGQRLSNSNQTSYSFHIFFFFEHGRVSCICLCACTGHNYTPLDTTPIVTIEWHQIIRHSSISDLKIWKQYHLTLNKYNRIISSS